GERTHPQVGREGPCARARGQGLRLGHRRQHRRCRSGGLTTTGMPTAAESYVAAFDELNAATAPDALKALRGAAFEQFAALGFPTTKNEDWHFTSVAPLADQEFTLLAAPTGDVHRDALAPYLFDSIGHVMVFVNGRFDASLSNTTALPAGVKL